jgi:aromatic ring-opening dioxygenase catalytic subunit (LigB family)
MPASAPVADTPPTRQPVLFVPHGGGPCFFMDGSEDWARMATYLRGVGAGLPRRPDAILVVSGHWETAVPSVTSGANPPLLYDYYGFPAETYRLAYPAPGAPDLAGRVRALLDDAGIPSAADARRGFDHGVFIPFMLAFPTAEIPIVELSLQQDLDPAAHLRLGRALAPLREQNVLIVATGMTYHNLRQFRGAGPDMDAVSAAFDDWLAQVVTTSPALRDAGLVGWEQAPGARACHPRAEHLLPLMVAAGAAGDDHAIRDYRDVVWGKALSGFRFG